MQFWCSEARGCPKLQGMLRDLGTLSEKAPLFLQPHRESFIEGRLSDREIPGQPSGEDSGAPVAADRAEVGLGGQ